MATWNHVHRAAPDLVVRARILFAATTNSVLATIRADGTPRVSGIDPWFSAGEMHIGSMPGSRKLADIERDARVAIHGIPWESRKVRQGVDDPGDGDVKLTGTALALDAGSRSQVRAAFERERGFEMPDGDLFRIDLSSLVLISVDDHELVLERWTESDGHVTTRRS